MLFRSAYDQLKVAKEVYDKNLSVRQTEELVRNILTKKHINIISRNIEIDPNIIKLQEQLGISLGTRVEIKHRPNGGGNVTIKYHNLDELDGLMDKFKLKIDV